MAERVASMSPEELIAVIERGLAADEDAAKAWLPFGNPDDAARAHIARHDPGRVLADVESKRAILAVAAKLFAVDHDHEKDEDGVEFGHPIARRRMWDVLCALARPYLDQEES